MQLKKSRKLQLVQERLETVTARSKRAVTDSRFAGVAMKVVKKIHIPVPEPVENYLSVPSKSMVPITAVGISIYSGLSLSSELRPFAVGLGVVNTLGNIAVGLHLRRQEQATEQVGTQEHLADILPFPEQKSA